MSIDEAEIDEARVDEARLDERGQDDTQAGDRPDGVPALRRSPLWAGCVAGVLTVAVLAGLCGWLGYRAHAAAQGEEARALLVRTARQAAVNLTTIDHQHAEADIQRILDSTTGPFHDDFQARSGPFIEAVKKAQSVSAGTVTEAGVESVDADQGQVLLAVTVRTAKQGGDEQPRYWRMRLTVDRQGEGAKVSKVDFVS